MSFGVVVPFLTGEAGLVNSFGVAGFMGVRDSIVLSLTKVGGVIVRGSVSC